MAADKINYRRLLRDFRSGDDDICIFALRNAMQLSRGGLRDEAAALTELIACVEELQPSWPTEVRFYAQRALEHLHALAAPVEDLADAEDPETAEVDDAELDDADLRVAIRCCKRIETQVARDSRAAVVSRLGTASDPLLVGALLSALGVVGTSSDLFLVKKFVSHANARVRAIVVDVIERLAGDPAVAEGMIAPFLEDRSGTVRARAILFVGTRDVTKVTAAVDKTLESPDAVERAALAEALCAIPSDHVVPALKRLSEDPEESVRVKLLESMERTDHPQKAFLLKKMVKDESAAVKRVAREALRRYETKRMLAIGGFQSQLPEGLPAAKRIQALEDIQDQQELDPIDLDDLKDPDPAVKLGCLRKIRQRHHEPAHRVVVGLLGTAENVETLAATLDCLTGIGTARDVETIMHFLNHNAGDVRRAAARAVEQLASPKQAVYLLLPMLHDTEVLVRGVVGRVLLRQPLDELLAHVAGMAGHGAQIVRFRLVRFLGNYAGPQVLTYLARAVGDESAAVRGAAVASLYPQEDPRADELLKRLEADPDERVRAEAGRALAARGRHAGTGRPRREAPSLDALLDVAANMADEAADAEEAARVAAEAAGAVTASAGDMAAGSVRSLVDRVSHDLTRAKELENLKLNRDIILEDMGRKLYTMIKRRDVVNPAFDRSSFLIDKYLHLQKQGAPADEKGSGLWAKIQKAAGVERESEHVVKLRESLRRSYVDLGRVAMDLSYRENVIYPELHMEYLELEAVEKRLREFGTPDAKGA